MDPDGTLQEVPVLLVDDRPENLTALEGLLSDQGYQLVKALSGNEALRSTLKRDFALVLLDVQMPDMDGFETAALLRVNPKTRQIPIIFVTAGMKDLRFQFRGYDAGAVDYLTKPIEPLVLRSKVRVFAELFRQRGELERHKTHLEEMVGERTAELRESAEKLQKSEARYRRITEGLMDYQYTVRVENGRAGETTQSPACEKVTGYTAAEFAADPYLWIRMVAPEDREMVRKSVEQVLAGKDIPALEHRIVRKDGETIWVSDTTILFRDASGNLLAYDGVIKDITVRKRAEEELRRSLEEKTVLLKEIHHRVKNNMQVIYSLLSLQAKTIADPLVRVMFEESQNRISSMALIHEQLYHSKDLARIDFKEYLQTLVQSIGGTFKRHDVQLSVDMESIALDVNTGIPCGLIVNELVSNCLKHAFPDCRKGAITLGITKNSAGNNILTVSDNGIGLPDTVDFRNTSSLGLQLVNVLTAQIHGTIELSKAEGTRFSITFGGNHEKQGR